MPDIEILDPSPWPVYFLFIGFEKNDGQKKVESRPSVVRLDRLRRAAEKKVPIFFTTSWENNPRKWNCWPGKRKKETFFECFKVNFRQVGSNGPIVCKWKEEAMDVNKKEPFCD